MLVRHNTSLVEKAVALVVARAAIPAERASAEAALRRAQAAARLRMATGAAIAIGAIGIGLGLMFGFGRRDETLRNMAQLPPIVTADGARVRYDVTKFAERSVDFLGRKWLVTSGHHFENDKDAAWRDAWCYVVQNISGVSVQISLAERDNPQAHPRALIASTETLARSGLDDASALELASKCVWLDQKTYGMSDFVKGRSPSRNIVPPPAPVALAPPQAPAPSPPARVAIPEPTAAELQAAAPATGPAPPSIFANTGSASRPTSPAPLNPPLDLNRAAAPPSNVFQKARKSTDPAGFGIY